MPDQAELLREALAAAVAAGDPERWLAHEAAALGWTRGAVRVISLGKAAVPMARTFAKHFSGPFDGLAVAPAGQGASVPGFTVLEGAHPIPDATSLAAGEAVLTFARSCRPDDLVVVLVSGGASALACAPIPGVTLEAKAQMTRRLLASGASISEINLVRGACSRIKKGGLADAMVSANQRTWIQSDVPGDDPDDVGSGPMAPRADQREEAVALLRRYAPDLVDALSGPILAHPPGGEGAAAGTANRDQRVLSSMRDAPDAAEAILRARGWPVSNLGLGEGDAAVEARRWSGLADARDRRALVSGGELTVEVVGRAPGRGGRNLHFLLNLAGELAGRADIWALAADTDGVDGSSPAAGAWIDPDLLANLDRREVDAALAAFDAHDFFERRGKLIRTGPTGVNLGDLRILLVDPPARQGQEGQGRTGP